MVSHTRHAKHVNVLIYINNEYIHIQKELEEKNILTKNQQLEGKTFESNCM